MDKMIKIEAYFGRDIDKTHTVTNADWETFKEVAINPRFECYTVRYTTGCWRGTDEGTYILELIVSDDHVLYLAGHKLAEIIKIYKAQFNQECVLVVHTAVKGMFI